MGWMSGGSKVEWFWRIYVGLLLVVARISVSCILIYYYLEQRRREFFPCTACTIQLLRIQAG